MAIRIEVGYRAGSWIHEGGRCSGRSDPSWALRIEDVRSYDVYLIDAELAPERS